MDKDNLKSIYAYISEDLHACWLDVPKNGSTSMRRHLQLHSPHGLGVWCPTLKSAKKQNKNLKLPKSHPQHVYKIPDPEFNKIQKKCYTFMIARNPYARAISSWLMLNDQNDARMSGKSWWDAYQRLSGKTRPNPKMSFLEYCKNLEYFIMYEKHVQRQVDFMFYKPDAVYKLENIDQWEDFLNKKLKISNTGNCIPLINNRKHKDYATYYNSVTKKIIENIYGADIEKFKYQYGE